jgi:predicted anti-sigma-YlaC factor YlaD
MNCPEFQEDIAEYLDGSLTVRGREAFEIHLAACDECRLALAKHEKLARELSRQFRLTTNTLTLNPDVRSRIVASLSSAAVPVSDHAWFLPAWRRLLMPWGLTAGLLISALVISHRFSGNHGLGLNSVEAAEPPITISLCVPQIETTYTFSKQDGFVIDSLVQRANLVQQTLRVTTPLKRVRNASKN